ncbi:MAG: macro domain-containing protein [Deltaproteobacteria bacterium]|nr:macro domain-containing protein [Deltaproteobacteria bacterium]
MSGRIAIIEGDIATQEVDAVVNAANSSLLLGSGVAGAIQRAGGPSIQEECDARGGIEVGSAAITGAGELPARFVIHAASMSPGGSSTEESIRESLKASLRLAKENEVRTLAVPAIGAGVGGVPEQRCAEILLEVVRAVQEGPDAMDEVRFVLFGEPTYRVFEMVNDSAKVAAQMARLKKLR